MSRTGKRLAAPRRCSNSFHNQPRALGFPACFHFTETGERLPAPCRTGFHVRSPDEPSGPCRGAVTSHPLLGPQMETWKHLDRPPSPPMHLAYTHCSPSSPCPRHQQGLCKCTRTPPPHPPPISALNADGTPRRLLTASPAPPVPGLLPPARRGAHAFTHGPGKARSRFCLHLAAQSPGCPLFSLLLSCVQTSSALWGLPEGSLPGGAGNVGLTPTGQKRQCSDVPVGWDGFLFVPECKGGSGGLIAGAGTGVDPLSPEGAVGCVSVWGVRTYKAGVRPCAAAGTWACRSA